MRASASSAAQRSESASIAASSSCVTFFMRMRLEWNVKRSGATASRARSIAGISVSIVVFELGTICPIRYVLATNRSLFAPEPQDLLRRPIGEAEEHALPVGVVRDRLPRGDDED